jgi:hypothetical protein
VCAEVSVPEPVSEPAELLLLLPESWVLLGSLIRGAVRAAISNIVVRVGAARWHLHAMIACKATRAITDRKAGEQADLEPLPNDPVMRQAASLVWLLVRCIHKAVTTII